MKAKGGQANFNRTAAGRYAQAMERGLTGAQFQLRPVKQGSVKRIKVVKLDGGCLVYRMLATHWRKS